MSIVRISRFSFAIVAFTISKVADASPPTKVSTESTILVTTVPTDLSDFRELASACMASWFDASIVNKIGCCESRWREAE